MHKVLIAVPAFGHMISAATFLTTHHLHGALIQRGIPTGITTLSFPDIAELRSMVLTIFHDTTDFTHLLMIDSDMGFQPDLVIEQLMMDEPLVGTIYSHRRLPQTWVGSGTGDSHAARRGNFMEVEGVGMGCTLIRRDLVQKMLAEMPELIDTRISLHPAFDILRSAGCSRLFRAFEKLDIPERGLISEDLSFCIRWRQLGGQVWASIGHRISHVGQHDFAGRYLDQFEQPVQQGLQPPVSPPAAPPPPSLLAAMNQQEVPVTAPPKEQTQMLNTLPQIAIEPAPAAAAA